MTIAKETQNYTWMLKHKISGDIHPTYTYKTRASARKACRSASGRFSNFTPVKVYAKTVTRTRTKEAGTITMCAKQLKSFNPMGGFQLSKGKRF